MELLVLMPTSKSSLPYQAQEQHRRKNIKRLSSSGFVVVFALARVAAFAKHPLGGKPHTVPVPFRDYTTPPPDHRQESSLLQGEFSCIVILEAP